MRTELYKVIIAGSRSFMDYFFLDDICNGLLIEKQPNIEIVSGTAAGADKTGEKYAKAKGYDLSKFPAFWDQYGKAAGYIRNKQMGEYTDAGILFWDGTSKGTMHMYDILKKLNKPVRLIRF